MIVVKIPYIQKEKVAKTPAWLIGGSLNIRGVLMTGVVAVQLPRPEDRNRPIPTVQVRSNDRPLCANMGHLPRARRMGGIGLRGRSALARTIEAKPEKHSKTRKSRALCNAGDLLRALS